MPIIKTTPTLHAPNEILTCSEKNTIYIWSYSLKRERGFGMLTDSRTFFSPSLFCSDTVGACMLVHVCWWSMYVGACMLVEHV